MYLHGVCTFQKVNECAISPDGTLLATGSASDNTHDITDIASQAGTYSVADLEFNKEIMKIIKDQSHANANGLRTDRTLPKEAGVGVAWSPVLSPDGTSLIAVTPSGSVVLVTNSNAHSTVYQVDKAVCIIIFAPFTWLIPLSS